MVNYTVTMLQEMVSSYVLYMIGMHKEAVSKSTTVEASSTPKRPKHGKRSKGKRRRDEHSSGKEQGEKR